MIRIRMDDMDYQIQKSIIPNAYCRFAIGYNYLIIGVIRTGVPSGVILQQKFVENLRVALAIRRGGNNIIKARGEFFLH